MRLLRVLALVIAAASTPEKRDYARSLGADAVLDTAAEGWRDRLKAALAWGETRASPVQLLGW